MASDTRNVKLGVCRVYFDGHDLGYTQGGVEVNATTQTHQVMVDQFGKTPINELIMGRDVKVKVPLAETTLDNMVRLMPGATLVGDGVKATGSITIATNPAAGETITVNGKTVTFRAVPTILLLESKIGTTAAETASNLAAFLTESQDAGLVVADYTQDATIPAKINVLFDVAGVAGNSFTLVTGTAAAKVTMSAATLTGGVAVTKAYVSVPTGIGINLLSIAKELRLHPKGKADNDRSDDFTIPLAATAGALQFAYKLENERIFNSEFQAYPDPTTDVLFYVGDPTGA